jgi:electron-transferring-flavoprotein dehydrogenase
MENPGDPCFESKAVPGMPLQVLCYERADDIAAGVSGVVTRARGIRASFPDLNPAEIPMAAEDCQRGTRALSARPDWRQPALHWPARWEIGCCEPPGRCSAWSAIPHLSCRGRPVSCTSTPGLVLSIGQFNQWVGSQLMEGGLVQIWPGTPVSAPIFSGRRSKGLRLADQGVGPRRALRQPVSWQGWMSARR